MEKDWLRYSCQMALPGFTEVTQQKMQSAKVLIVGAGGLGCPAAQYLVAAGVGTIGIADSDTISVSNLHRQILFTPDEVGKLKSKVACRKLQSQNPLIKLISIAERITSENAIIIIEQYDIVVDGTDNFETKYLLNDACVILGKPLVYGAIYQYEGQVAVWNILNMDGTRSPNFRDIFPMINETAIPNCSEGGVLPTVAGIIGCMQATEVIKFITGVGELLSGKLLLLDAATLQTRIIKIGKATTTQIKCIEPTKVIKTIRLHDLKNILKDDRYQLVDVRTVEEHAAFNIGGVNIPLSDFSNGSMYETNKAVIFYCTTGKRSAEAVKFANKNFPALQVFSLDEGIKAWQEQII